MRRPVKLVAPPVTVEELADRHGVSRARLRELIALADSVAFADGVLVRRGNPRGRNNDNGMAAAHSTSEKAGGQTLARSRVTTKRPSHAHNPKRASKK